MDAKLLALYPFFMWLLSGRLVPFKEYMLSEAKDLKANPFSSVILDLDAIIQ